MIWIFIKNKIVGLWLWFRSLKPQIQAFIIVGLIVTIIIGYLSIRVAYFKYKLYKEQSKQIDILQDEKVELIKELAIYKLEQKKIQKERVKQDYEIEILKEQLKSKRNEIKKVPFNVRNYPDRKLDSILTNHRHIERAKN